VSELNPLDWSESRLAELLERSRIDAVPQLIDAGPSTSVLEVIHEQSRDADLVLMGLRNPAPSDEEEYAARLTRLVGDLPTVILVHAAGPFAGQLLETVETPTVPK
jgi:nucleotide-binding universal stress UspA family protein